MFWILKGFKIMHDLILFLYPNNTYFEMKE